MHQHQDLGLFFEAIQQLPFDDQVILTRCFFRMSSNNLLKSKSNVLALQDWIKQHKDNINEVLQYMNGAQVVDVASCR